MWETDRTGSTEHGRLRAGGGGDPAQYAELSEGGASRTRSGRTVDRRGLIKATGGTGLGVALAGCLDVFGAAAADDSDGPLTIGVLAPDPERGAIGRSMAFTARLAAAQWNENGGLLGREVDVVVRDTKGSPLQARRAYHHLVLDDDVDVTMGISETRVLEHLIDDIAEQETLHFTTGATGIEATQRVENDYDRYKYHFRTMLNDFQLIANHLQGVEAVIPRLGWESVAVLTEAYPWTSDLTGLFESQLPSRGADVTMVERYPPQIDDFDSLFADAESSGADAVWVAMAFTGDDAILDWHRLQPSLGFGGIHVPMQLPAYWDLTDGACQYGITTTSATENSDITPVTSEYVDAYKERYDGDLPVYTGYLTYNATLMYAAAVRAAGTFETDRLIEELVDIEEVATTGLYSFHGPDGTHPHDPAWDPTDPESPGSILIQWQETDGGGEQEVIWPDHLATADVQHPHWI